MGLSAIAVDLIASGQPKFSDRSWMLMQSGAGVSLVQDFVAYLGSFLLVSQIEI